MFSTTRKTMLTLAAIGAFGAGGAAIAGAASTGSSSPAQRAADRALSGDAAAKVTAAAKNKVSGGTVLRVEAGGPHDAPYHAHVRKSDGSEVVVLVSSSYEATAVQDRPAHRGGPGRHGHHGRHGGREREALAAATAAKVRAAAKAKVSGGTVLRVEAGGPYDAPYHAHVRKSDGSEVVVLVSSSYAATAVQQPRHP